MTDENTGLDLAPDVMSAGTTQATSSEVDVNSGQTSNTAEVKTFDLDSLPFDKIKSAYLTKIQDPVEKEVYEKNLNSIKDINALMNSFVHSQKALGSKVAVPSKDATAEDWDKFYSKIGKPTNADLYDLKNDYLEFDEGTAKQIKEGFYAAGLNTKQASTVISKIAELSEKASEARKAAIEAGKQKTSEIKASMFGKDLVKVEAEVEDYIKGIVTTKEDFETLTAKVKEDPKLLEFFSKIRGSSTPKSPNDLVNSATTGYKTSKEIVDEIFSNPAYKNDWFSNAGRNMPASVVQRLRTALQDPKLYD